MARRDLSPSTVRRLRHHLHTDQCRNQNPVGITTQLRTVPKGALVELCFMLPARLWVFAQGKMLNSCFIKQSSSVFVSWLQTSFFNLLPRNSIQGTTSHRLETIAHTRCMSQLCLPTGVNLSMRIQPSLSIPPMGRFTPVVPPSIHARDARHCLKSS